jgi:nicotinamidase/pyrazinamidase
MFSAYWHPPYSDHFKPIGPWPSHGIAGTWDAEFLSGLDIPESSFIFRKGVQKETHGYDPFEGKTDDGLFLEKVLKNFEVNKIVAWGIAIDYCLKAFVLHALKLGYEVYVAIDASVAVNINPNDEQNAIEEMRIAGAIITTTEEIILKRPRALNY